MPPGYTSPAQKIQGITNASALSVMNLKLSLVSFLALGLTLASQQQPQGKGLSSTTNTTCIQLSPFEQLSLSLMGGKLDDFKASLPELLGSIEISVAKAKLLEMVCEFGDADSLKLIFTLHKFDSTELEAAQAVSARTGNLETLMVFCGRNAYVQPENSAFQYLVLQSLSHDAPTSAGSVKTLALFLEVYPEMAEKITSSRILAKAIEHGQLEALNKFLDSCPHMSIEKISSVAYKMAVQNGQANMIELFFSKFVQSPKAFADYLCAAALSKKPAAFLALVRLGKQAAFIDASNVERVTIASAAAFEHAVQTQNVELKKVAVSLIMDPIASLQARINIMQIAKQFVAMNFFSMQLVMKSLGRYMPREILELIVSNNL